MEPTYRKVSALLVEEVVLAFKYNKLVASTFMLISTGLLFSVIRHWF